jgi:hypothetical protein
MRHYSKTIDVFKASKIQLPAIVIWLMVLETYYKEMGTKFLVMAVDQISEETEIKISYTKNFN